MQLSHSFIVLASLLPTWRRKDVFLDDEEGSEEEEEEVDTVYAVTDDRPPKAPAPPSDSHSAPEPEGPLASVRPAGGRTASGDATLGLLWRMGSAGSKQ